MNAREILNNWGSDQPKGNNLNESTAFLVAIVARFTTRLYEWEPIALLT
jgi:hypothetical protein